MQPRVEIHGLRELAIPRLASKRGELITELGKLPDQGIAHRRVPGARCCAERSFTDITRDWTTGSLSAFDYYAEFFRGIADQLRMSTSLIAHVCLRVGDRRPKPFRLVPSNIVFRSATAREGTFVSACVAAGSATFGVDSPVRQDCVD